MAWTTPTARTTGELITASIWNTDLKDNLILIKTSIADDGRVSGEIKNYRQEKSALTIAANVLTVDLSAANHFTFTLNANITTMTLSNVPASGKLASFVLEMIANGTGYTWAWLTSTVKWAGGVAPAMTTTNAKVDRFGFLSTDGGTTWIGFVIGQAYAG